MSYFESFREVDYLFGNTSIPVAFQDLSVYSDMLDQISDIVSHYSYYNILDGDRPDSVSAKLYDNPAHSWTFFLSNDHIRESGWPLTRLDLEDKLDEIYTGCAVITKDDFYGSIIEGTNDAGPTLRVGDTLTGSVSATTGTVTKLDPNNGQIFMDVGNVWSVGEEITWRDENNTLQSLEITSCVNEKNAVHHYEDSDGNYVDIDPSVGAGSLLTEVTIRDTYLRRNDELREIRVIKPEYIESVVSNMQASLEG